MNIRHLTVPVAAATLLAACGTSSDPVAEPSTPAAESAAPTSDDLAVNDTRAETDASSTTTSTTPAAEVTSTPTESTTTVSAPDPEDVPLEETVDYSACGVSLTGEALAASLEAGALPSLSAAHPEDFAENEVSRIELFVSEISATFPTAVDGGQDVDVCAFAVPGSADDGELTTSVIVMNRSSQSTAAGIQRLAWTAVDDDGQELPIELTWEGGGCTDGRLLPPMTFSVMNCSHVESPTSRVRFSPDAETVVSRWNDPEARSRVRFVFYTPTSCGEDSISNGVEVCVIGRGQPVDGAEMAFTSVVINRTEVAQPVNISGFVALYPRDQSQQSQFGMEWFGACEVPGGISPQSAKAFTCSLNVSGDDSGARFLPSDPSVFLNEWNTTSDVISATWLLGAIADVG